MKMREKLIMMSRKLLTSINKTHSHSHTHIHITIMNNEQQCVDYVYFCTKKENKIKI